jgi:hypothetical protein
MQDLGEIHDLGPSITGFDTDYQLAGQFKKMANENKMASGGLLQANQQSLPTYDVAAPFIGAEDLTPRLRPNLTRRNINYQLPGYERIGFAEGGSIEGHNPQFFSEGGLNSLENRYVTGAGDGTSDEVPAMLANGEFVIPADVVSALGNGSNESGASVLDQLLQVIREHRQDHDPEDLPPDSAGPLAYLLEAKKRA